MFAIIGVLVVTGCVLGGYAMAHGPFAILFQPAEVIIIGGASLGGLLIGTPLPVLKIIAHRLLIGTAVCFGVFYTVWEALGFRETAEVVPHLVSAVISAGITVAMGYYLKSLRRCVSRRR